MLARQVRDDGIHAGSLTLLGQIAAGTQLDPDRIADAYWAIRNEDLKPGVRNIALTVPSRHAADVTGRGLLSQPG